jgi:hypothetical protein
MAFEINAIKTDKQKDVEGVWTEPRPGLELLIARLGNPRYQNELRRLTKPYRGRRGNLTDEEDRRVLDECTAKAAAKCILLGWRGLCENGVEVEYSVERAEKYIREVDEFRSMVMDEAADLDHFRMEDEESAAKNLQMSSGGKAAGGLKLRKPSGGPAADSAS